MGLPGLATDVITMKELLTFRLNLYRLREEREIKPETFSALLSHILYQKRRASALEAFIHIAHTAHSVSVYVFCLRFHFFFAFSCVYRCAGATVSAVLV